MDYSPEKSQPLARLDVRHVDARRPRHCSAYRTTNTVIEFEPDRRIAWKTDGPSA